MTIHLRPHHLLCILTYAGMGYTPAFAINFTALVRRILDGEDIQITQGPDDICAPLADTENLATHCLSDKAATRDQLAADALTLLLESPIQTGQPFALNPDILAKMRAAFVAGTIRKACEGCEWEPVCTVIARNQYFNTFLNYPAVSAESE